MSSPVLKEDWEALIEALTAGYDQLADKRTEPLKQSILEFSTTCAMLGMEDLARAGKKLEEFFLQNVAPDWNEEARVTLGFAMGGLIEKMRRQDYGVEFSASLDEVLLYLEFFEEDSSGDETDGAAILSEPDTADAHWSDSLDHRPELSPPVVRDHLSAVDESDTPGAEAAQPLKVEHGEPELPLPDSAVVRVQKRGDSEGCADTLECFRRMLKMDPASNVFVLLAEELCSRGLWSDAVAVCRSGLLFHPGHLRGRVLLGWALWELGATGEGERILTEALGDLEKNAVIYRILAEAATRRDDSDRARHLMNVYHAVANGNIPPGSTRMEPVPFIEREAAHLEPEGLPVQSEAIAVETETAPLQPEEVKVEPEAASVEIEAVPVMAEAAHMEPGAAPERSIEKPKEAAVRIQALDSSIVHLLSVLLSKFEEKPARATSVDGLFSEADRRSLQLLLRGSAES